MLVIYDCLLLVLQTTAVETGELQCLLSDLLIDWWQWWWMLKVLLYTFIVLLNFCYFHWITR